MKKVIIIIILVCVVIITTVTFLLKSGQSTASNTNRYSLDYYKSLQLNTPYSVVTEKVGQPDSEIGSGIYIFVYKLQDESEIWLGYADLEKLMYVKQKMTNGTIIDLVTK